ncbi:MAG: sigma 54-interacting transcriptional regulator, partial [Granulosicoccaceae bacterium]
RLVSATHVNLEQAVEDGNFREDLYYRLNVVTLDVPALADRREDIKLLANHFMQQVIEQNPHCQARSLSPEATNRLVSAPWPGNVRQLRNVMEQVCVLSSTQVISEQLVTSALRGKDDRMQPLAEAQTEFERDYLVSLLRTTAGNVTHAAKLAKRNRTEFYKLLHKHKLDAAVFRKAN